MIGTRSLIVVLLTVLVLVGVGFGLSYLWGVEGTTSYSGTVVFTTEEDYVDFKLAFAGEDVDLLDVAILASEPPMIVSFEAQVSHYNYEFPYGERSIQGYYNRGTGGIVGFGILCLLALVAAWQPVLWLSDWAKEWDKE